MIFSVCCHTKNFDEIDQFIDHNLNLGFDRIVLYDNSDRNLVSYNDPRVIIVRWEKSVLGLPTYQHYIDNFSNVGGWTAFIDEDEFINTGGRNIKDSLGEFQDFDSLSINWRVFTDEIDEGNYENLLTKKYLYYIKKEVRWASRHTKCICKNDSIENFTNPHYANLKENKKSRNVKGDIVEGPFNDPAIWEKIWIDHYHLRGLENYIERKKTFYNRSSDDIAIKSYYGHKNNPTEKINENKCS